MKKIIIITIAITAFVIMIPIILWTINFYSLPISKVGEDWAYFGNFIGGIITPIIAFCSFMGLLFTIYYQWKQLHQEEKWKKNEGHFAHAVSFIERSYEIISNGGKELVPVKSRLAWLTCARFLLTAQKFAEKIDEESIKEKYWDEKEYWSNKFYEFFQITDQGAFSIDSKYFSKPSSISGDCIEERSIAVIYKFMEWPEGRIDPIESVEKYTDQEIKKMPFWMVGIKEYLSKKRNIT